MSSSNGTSLTSSDISPPPGTHVRCEHRTQGGAQCLHTTDDQVLQSLQPGVFIHLEAKVIRYCETLQSAIHPNNRRICEPHVTRIVGLLYPRKLSANCADILLERASS